VEKGNPLQAFSQPCTPFGAGITVASRWFRNTSVDSFLDHGNSKQNFSPAAVRRYRHHDSEPRVARERKIWSRTSYPIRADANRKVNFSQFASLINAE
jgi:hypothetical protein